MIGPVEVSDCVPTSFYMPRSNDKFEQGEGKDQRISLSRTIANIFLHRTLRACLFNLYLHGIGKFLADLAIYESYSHYTFRVTVHG